MIDSAMTGPTSRRDRQLLSKVVWSEGSRLFAVTVLCLVSTQAGFAQSLQGILYTSWGSLCGLAPAGGRPQCLKGRDEFDSPSWQPGGARIVAEAGQHDGPHSLVLLDRAGRQLRRLDGSSGYIRPTWTPDGQNIFAINYELGSAVARWDAKGTNKTTLRVVGGSEAGRRFQMISVSPSGNRAALLTMHFEEMILATISAGGLTAFATVPRDFSYVSQSVWRDEDHILFVGKRDSRTADLWELSVSTGAVTKFGIDGLSLRDQIVISPDRQAVAVTAAENSGNGNWNVWSYSLSTQRKTRLTNGTEEIVASWR
jgi:Tol biopolymer transport system component